MLGEFLIMKWDWIEETLSPEELNLFFNFLIKASEDKPDERYELCHKNLGKDKCPLNSITLGKKISKEEVIKSLNELGECDPEVALLEAEELLLRYINDKEIEKSFESIKNRAFLK